MNKWIKRLEITIAAALLGVILFVGAAKAFPDAVTSLTAKLYWRTVADGQVVKRSGTTLIGTDDLRNLRLAALTYSAGYALDFDPTLPTTKTAAITSVTPFTYANLAAGRVIDVFLTGDGSSRNISFPAGTIFLNATPTALAANKHAKMTLTSTTTAASGVMVLYSVEP